MSQVNNVWIAANHSFQRFDNRLIRYLAQYYPVARWEYYQHQDEPSCLKIALSFLENYLDSLEQPVNLIGHGTGGLLGLLYASQQPEKVQSLTLLGVGCYPAVDWQIHYYALRELLPCSQRIILAQMVQKIFGRQNQYNTKGLSKILQQDLNTSPSPHSLFRRISINPRGIKSPLMVCGSANDTIIDRNALRGWQKYLKKEDILWECPQGNHFFHYFYPQEVSRQVIKFWQNVEQVEQERLGEVISNKPI
jgi:pimeloyl-ACP methyl ester carboxylesterase